MTTKLENLKAAVAELDAAMNKRNFFSFGKNQEADDLSVRRCERKVIDAARLVAASLGKEGVSAKTLKRLLGGEA